MRYEMRRIVAARNVARDLPDVSAAALARCKCVRTALCLLSISACAASAAQLQKDADRDNPRASSNALAAFTRGRELAPLELPVLGQTPPMGTVTGTPVGDKGLIAVPSSAAAAPALGFVEDSCARGDSCGCDVSAEYHVWREGERVVIAHMVPDVEVHVVKHSGSCGEGCGVQAPSPPSTVLSLGAIDPSTVEIDDVHYHYDLVEETCDHPLPVP